MTKINTVDASQAIGILGSVIEDIKTDGTRIILKEKDGSESDVTEAFLPFLGYALEGIKLTATNKIDEANDAIREGK